MNGQTVYLDSSAIAKRYLVEEGTDTIDSIFKQAEMKRVTLCFSIWNIGEVLVAFDKQHKRNRLTPIDKVVSNFVNEMARLTNIGSVKIVGITFPVFFDSLDLILKYELYLADALQIVSCKNSNCDVFYTADKKLYQAAMKEKIKAQLIGG